MTAPPEPEAARRQPVGFSTGALATGSPLPGVGVSLRHRCPVIELSALVESELPAVEQINPVATGLGFSRISVHGPASGRQLPEPELIGRLVALDRDVVMHPDTLEQWSAWNALGSRLLIENMDARKTMGQDPGDLDRVFAEVPEARLCLDVSHALDVGGLELVMVLAEYYEGRLAQLHAGCACGHQCTPELEGFVVEAVREVWALCGWEVPLILERKVPAGQRRVQASQLTAFR